MNSDDETKKNENKSKEKRHHCKKCDKYYASFKSYGNHIRSYHNNNIVKPQCQYCGNIFTRRDNLQQHIRLFHSIEDTKLSCQICNRPFLNKRNWIKHVEKCSKSGKNIKWTNRIVQRKKISPKKLNIVINEMNKTDKKPLHTVKIPGVGCQEVSCHSLNSIDSTSKYPQQCSPNHADVFPTEKQFSYNINNIKSKEEFNFKKSRTKKDLSTITLTSDLSCEGKVGGKEYDGAEANNEVQKAMDCFVCDITFLSKEDYNCHLPFCHAAF